MRMRIRKEKLSIRINGIKNIYNKEVRLKSFIWI